jgi:Spy/CpxP family protein refolding chaperone
LSTVTIALGAAGTPRFDGIGSKLASGRASAHGWTRMEHPKVLNLSNLGKIGTIATVLVGALAAVSCGGASVNARPPATAASASDVDEVAAGLTEHHRHHHHGGVTLLIALSLDTLGVSPEQRPAVEKIRRDLHARMEPARAAQQRLAAALADGVAAANLDERTVDAAIAQVSAAAATVHDASTDALNELHAVLTPPERAALVDKVEAHWSVWQKANAEETVPANSKGSRLAELATDLGLTQDQVDKIRAGLGERMEAFPRLDPHEIATHIQAFGNAFRSEKFDAKALTGANSANAHLAGWGAAHLARFVESVSPVLTPDQRAEFSQRLREHSVHTNGGNE